MGVEIRAISVIKMVTPTGSTVDLTYRKGSKVESVAKDMVHALIQHAGTEEAKRIILDKIASYDAGYKGLEYGKE